MATTFDALLACLFPLALLFVGYRLRSEFVSWSELRHLLFPGSKHTTSNASLFSLERAYHAFLQYGKLSRNEISRMHTSYATLGRAHKNLGYRIGYPQKLDRLWEVTSLNATVAEDIADMALKEYPQLNEAGPIHTSSADLARVREALKHFVRDWSEEGAEERDRIFDPILNLLQQVAPSERSKQKILVPGSGLGRLSWEIAQLGYDTTANELSYFMLLAFRFILSPESTKLVNQHKVRPYAHYFSHQRNNESLFRAISFPDVLPRLTPTFRLLDTDFLKIPTPRSHNVNAEFWRASNPTNSPDVTSEGYHYIVTLFFIDTSTNVFATMEQIYRLLRPGGSWINLGPLLWTAGGQTKLELSLDELLSAAEEIGFVVQRDHPDDHHPEARRSVECEYTGDRNAMMRYTYKTEFWVARKSK